MNGNMASTTHINVDAEEVMTPEKRRAVWGAFIGFFVDNYDIFLPVIALAPAMHYFLPEGIDPTIAMIAGSMIFATTLIGRPIGAMIFGPLADTIGRKKVTVFSIYGFAVITLIMAALPGYQHWGSTVIWVFIGLRFVDGILLGGQYTGATPLAMEMCPKPKRGLYGALIQSAASWGTAFIAVVTMITVWFVPAGDLHSPYVQWGWRIPFIFGALMAFAMGTYYVLSVEESEIWEETNENKKNDNPLKTLFQGNNLKAFLQIFIFMSGFWLLLNASLAVMPGLLAGQLGLHGDHLTTALVISYVVLAVFYILGGMASQHIGRRNFLLMTSVISAVFGTLAYYFLLNSGGQSSAIIVTLATITTTLVVWPGALSAVYLNERFQTSIRSSGFGIGYSLAIVLPAFYGFYQAGLEYIMPAKYTVLVLVIVGSILVFVGAALGPETKDVDFN